MKVNSHRRLVLVAALTVIAFAFLAGWLANIQVRQHDRFKDLAEANLRRPTPVPAHRGAILDRNGTLLATSLPTKTVCADPSMIFAHHALIARAVAGPLGLNEDEVLRQLLPRLRMNSSNIVMTNSYVVLKKDVGIDRWQQVTQALAAVNFGIDEKKLSSRKRVAFQAVRQKAIFAVDDELRQYPGGSLSAHVLGFVASGENETDQGRVFEDHGLSGIELTFDDVLSGVHGWRQSAMEVAPRAGLNVVLTLDASIQSIVEEEIQKARTRLSPTSVCAIVVRPQTGEILALANQPTFDPNHPGASPDGYRNHAISDLVEPGSTFKTVTITTALGLGLVTLDERIDCENGRWLYGGVYLHDHHAFGTIPYLMVVAKSSNIGTAKASLRMGPDRLYNAITNFGFGAFTRIPLPGEGAGVIRPISEWSRISITRVAIGHEVSATPLQMAMAVSAIANGGTLMQPLLVQRIEDEAGRAAARNVPRPLRRVASEAACREMVRALKTVATQDGTAQAAALEYYTVAGKTGTAEKFWNGTYKSGRYYSSFIGFFPADSPQLCILVAIDEPNAKVAHFGGDVAAPVFKAIGERVANYLRIPPEMQPDRTLSPGPTGKPAEQPDLLVNHGEGKSKPAGFPRRTAMD